MFVVANLLVAVAQVLDYILWAYLWILIGRMIVSWVNADAYNPIVRFLYSATEPALERGRRRLRLGADRRLDRGNIPPALSYPVAL